MKPSTLTRLTAIGALVALGAPAQAWDHSGHMTTAAIAFTEIERTHPELIEKLGMLLLGHPDPGPFWVASTDTMGHERTRRMFIEAARWADDVKGTIHDRPTYHTARYPLVREGASEETRALVEARGGEPVGDALAALELHARILANPEANRDERALALSWLMHIVGDIHQPLHVTDLFDAENPTGNAAGSLSYVWDPLKDSATPIHILWDVNSFRSTELSEIDSNAEMLLENYPRSSFPQLGEPTANPDFNAWALEAHKIGVEFAYEQIEMTVDPDQDAAPDEIMAKIVNYVLNGVSPLDDAPEVPAEYWEQLQVHSHSQIALAGYRIADIIVAAADQIFTDHTLAGDVLDSLQRHGTPNN